MTKRVTEHSREPGGGMSREDRKNEAISRMIERQEQLRKKREEKKKLAVLNQKNGTSSNKPNGPAGQRKPKLLQTSGPSEPKSESSRVQIDIIFSPNAIQQNSSNRYFFERKQTIEERQRQEHEEYWAKFAQSQHMAQFLKGSQNAHFQGQGMGYYMNASGGTGGNYEVPEDYTGSSYLSSASKRQRQNEEWGQNQGQAQMYMTQQSMVLPLTSGYSNMWNEPTSAQQIQHNTMISMQQAALAQQLNNNQFVEDQSPSQNHAIHLPTPSTPFVNPISEESSANIDLKKDQELQQEGLVKVNVKLPTKKEPMKEQCLATRVSDVTTSTGLSEAQQIIELTKHVQEQLQKKRSQAAPPADANNKEQQNATDKNKQNTTT